MTLTLVPDVEADEDATAWLFSRPRTRTPSEAVARFGMQQSTNTADPDEQSTRRHPVHPAAPPNGSEFGNVGAIDDVIDDLDKRFHVLGCGPNREDVVYTLRNFIGYAHNRNGFDLDADTMAAVLTS